MEEEINCLKCKEAEEVNRQLQKIIAQIKSDVAFGEQKVSEFIENAKELEKKLNNQAPTFPFGPIPHWVKCCDRLPKSGEGVLLYYGYAIGCINENNDAWKIFDYEVPLEAFNYWLPLPPPPKDE